MKVLIIVSTKYQLFTALNIVLQHEENEYFLFIMDYNNEMISYKNMLDSLEIFEASYVIYCKEKFEIGVVQKSRIHRLIKNIKNLVKGYFFIHNNHLPDLFFEKVFLAGPDLPSNLIFAYYKRLNNNNIKFYLYEEGIYSYYVLQKNKNRLKYFIYSLMFNMQYSNDLEGIFVYKPSLLSNNTKYKTFKIDSKYVLNNITIYNSVFTNSCTTLDKFKYIFFDSAFENVYELEKQRQGINYIVDLIDKNKILIRLHPRSNKNYYDFLDNFDTQSGSFELAVSNIDLSDKIFITIFSTSCFTPNLIYEKMPKLILLYKVLNIAPPLGSINDFIENFSKEYKNLYVPKDFDELKQIIK